MEFEMNRRTYVSELTPGGEDGRTGCAFNTQDLGDPGCNKTPSCTGVIFVRKADVDPDASAKPTNPKDAIGIRKAPLSCLPMNVVAEMGTAMLEGAAKYGRHNFRAMGVRDSVYFDATMRHLIAYWEGENLDPDSGLSHLVKAMVSLAVWRDAQMQGKCTDDRPPRSVPFYPRLNEAAAATLDRHEGKSPRHYTIEDVIHAEGGAS